jgi:hypothetical protein
MSEGDIWLHKAVHEVTLAIRLSPFIVGSPVLDATLGPVGRADTMMREFCTKELRSVPGGTFGVEAYIANATMDLVIMATWALMIEQIPEAEPLPVSEVSYRVCATLINCYTSSKDIYIRA